MRIKLFWLCKNVQKFETKHTDNFTFVIVILIYRVTFTEFGVVFRYRMLRTDLRLN